MSRKIDSTIAVVGIDIGKNSFHVVGHDERGAIVLRQKWSRSQARLELIKALQSRPAELCNTIPSEADIGAFSVMSALGQFWTHAPHQKTVLFDHLIDASEQSRWQLQSDERHHLH
jgi:hypothetical protein